MPDVLTFVLEIAKQLGIGIGIDEIRTTFKKWKNNLVFEGPILDFEDGGIRRKAILTIDRGSRFRKPEPLLLAIGPQEKHDSVRITYPMTDRVVKGVSIEIVDEGFEVLLPKKIKGNDFEIRWTSKHKDLSEIRRQIDEDTTYHSRSVMKFYAEIVIKNNTKYEIHNYPIEVTTDTFAKDALGEALGGLMFFVNRIPAKHRVEYIRRKLVKIIGEESITTLAASIVLIQAPDTPMEYIPEEFIKPSQMFVEPPIHPLKESTQRLTRDLRLKFKAKIGLQAEGDTILRIKGQDFEAIVDRLTELMLGEMAEEQSVKETSRKSMSRRRK